MESAFLKPFEPFPQENLFLLTFYSLCKGVYNAGALII